MTMLDDDLLAADAANNRTALVTLYTQAADATETLGAACFYLTHAYVFALELDHPDTATLHARLAHHGRV